MAAASSGYRAGLLRRQLTSLLPGTAGLPPFISFSTNSIGVEHIRIESTKSFPIVRAALDRNLPRLDLALVQAPLFRCDWDGPCAPVNLMRQSWTFNGKI
jgi:hypothetical protein